LNSSFELLTAFSSKQNLTAICENAKVRATMPIIAQVQPDDVRRTSDGRCIVKFELSANKDYDSCLVPGTVVIVEKPRRRGVRPYEIIGVCYEVTRTTPEWFLARTRPITTQGASKFENVAPMEHAKSLFFYSYEVWSSRTEIKRACQWLQFVEKIPSRRPEATELPGMRSFDVTVMDLPDFEWPTWTSRLTITNLYGTAFAMDEADQTVDREFALKDDTECTVCHEVCANAFVTCGYCMNQLHAACLAGYAATAGDSSKKCTTCRNLVF
jgi:hypothetical protein